MMRSEQGMPGTDAYETLMQFLYRAPIGLVQCDLNGSIDMMNPMSVSLLMPLSPNGALDNFFDAMAGVAPELHEMTLAMAAPSGVICEGLRVTLSPAGAPSQVVSVSLLKLDGARLMAALTDVTGEVEREREGLARRLHDATHTDSLTRLPNRIAVLEHLQRVLARATREPDYEFAVLFMNCDRFKQINNTLGPAGGDAVLALMADRLRATLRQGDRVGRPHAEGQLVGRIGGDEFVVVIDELRRADDVHAIASRLLGVLSKPYSMDDRQAHCAVSMGVVLRAQAKHEPDALLQDASIAMVEAKRAGGMRYVVFEPAMQERAARRGGIEAELRRALNDNELFVVYQPVIDLKADGDDRACAGVEALVRWQHPVRGLVPPFEFIEVAEECGLICALGSFVLDAACRQFMQWQRLLGARAPTRLAVNLSRAQLVDPELTGQVRQILLRHAMPAARLQLEVTESLAAQDATVQARLKELKELGLTLALDDFGTGYSSLASLHLLPVDTVKIDRSFVSHADTSHHHRVLIDATVRVAGSLGMDTVAEGIETEAQAGIVDELGCDKGQGYLFSKPLRAAELLTWLNESSASHAA